MATWKRVAFSSVTGIVQKMLHSQGGVVRLNLCAFMGGESKCSRIVKLITLFEMLPTDRVESFLLMTTSEKKNRLVIDRDI